MLRTALPARVLVLAWVLAGCQASYATQISISVDTDLGTRVDAVRVRVLHGCTDGRSWLGTPDGRLPASRDVLPTRCATYGDGRGPSEHVPVIDPATGAPAGELAYVVALDRVFTMLGATARVAGCDDRITRLPLTLTVLPPGSSECGGMLPFVVVEAIGIPHDAADRAWYSARQARFVPGTARTLSAFLTECACDVGSTCDAAGRCVPVAEGEDPDAGVAGDAGACVPGFADCDATPGCEADLANDAAHCGRCDHACATGEQCASGTCHVQSACNPGDTVCGGDCVDTSSDPANCGGCGVVCVAGEECVATHCRPTSGCGAGLTSCGGVCVDLVATHQASGCGACDVGWADCNAGPGCESQLGTAVACHGCAENCAAAHLTTCTSGGCTGPCESGWTDCDVGVAGCETQLGTLTDCTSCGEDCAAAHLTTCTSSGCTGPCEPGWLECPGRGIGCAVPSGTLTDCTGCGEDCAAAHLTTCTSSGCTGPCEPGWVDCGPGPGCETAGTSCP